MISLVNCFNDEVMVSNLINAVGSNSMALDYIESIQKRLEKVAIELRGINVYASAARIQRYVDKKNGVKS